MNDCRVSCSGACHSSCDSCAGLTGYVSDSTSITHCSGSVNLPMPDEASERIQALCNDIKCYCHLNRVTKLDNNIQKMIDQFCVDIKEIDKQSMLKDLIKK